MGLAGGIAYAGYGTGVHDALSDPEGTTKKILEQVLSASGGSKLLPVDRPDSLLVQRLGEEIVAAANASLDAELVDLQAAAANRAAPTDDEKEAMARVASQQQTMRRAWRFVVIDDPAINAFVTDQLPGYVFVHRGLIELMKRSPEKLSFVIAHELGHHLADHNQSARNMSMTLSMLQLLVFAAVDPTGVVAFMMELGAMSTLFQYTLQLPSSRSHEFEADAIGLQLVTRACRNPTEAIKAHEVLAQYELKRGGMPDVTQLHATHPATLQRVAELKKQLPDAVKEYKKGGCWHRKEAWRRLSYTDRLARAPREKPAAGADAAEKPSKRQGGGGAGGDAKPAAQQQAASG